MIKKAFYVALDGDRQKSYPGRSWLGDIAVGDVMNKAWRRPSSGLWNPDVDVFDINIRVANIVVFHKSLLSLECGMKGELFFEGDVSLIEDEWIVACCDDEFENGLTSSHQQ